MCGIAGFYGFNNNQLIKKISQELKHRGPDGEGLYIDDQITLLNRRLAIIDIKGGNQPIYNEDKTVVVVYNGEIYNYQELRKELERKGHFFKTHSDTEIIAHGYEEWGEDCFDRFNGMFAIALYDKKNQLFLLARDHFGIKPLYYSLINHLPIKLIFSSEIKPIFYSGLIEKKANDKVIYRYLQYRVHDDNKETFFQGIYRLMPGEILKIKNQKLKIKNFTEIKEFLLNKQGIEKIEEKTIVRFKEELTKAIRCRLVSEVSVGTCLSGGLDSSTVVGIVNQLLKKKVNESVAVGENQKTFSAIFPDGTNNEEEYINCLIDYLETKIKNYKIYPKAEEFFQEIQDFIRTQEEPTISSGPYAQYKVMENAAKEVTVLLDGQGADEMMAGYLPYYFIYLNQLLTQFKKEKKVKALINLIKEIWGAKDIIIGFLTKKILERLKIKENLKMERLLNKDFLINFEKEDFLPINDNLKKRLVNDIFYHSLPALLRYEDKNTMRFSIEGRVPFLDINLINFLFSLSDEAIINNGWNKFILRQATKTLLPEKINQRRNKIGFTTPEYQWFMRMKNKIYQIFLSESFAKRKYFNQKEVLVAFQKFIQGKIDDTMIFWRLLNLELWLREFFDKKKKEEKTDYFLGKPNQGKKIIIEVNKEKNFRYPIKTNLFEKGDDFAEKIKKHFCEALMELKETKKLGNKNVFLVVSEKIVAISQGRSFFLWEIKPGFWAKLLSKFVSKTPFGIGLGSPWTMELAIKEVGLLKIFLATIISAITKPFGMKGWFYKIAGKEVAAIDGPTEYSLYPSNISAKLGPKEPEKAAEKIDQKIRNSFYQLINDVNFLGVVIIDANDLGQKVLGNTTGLENSLIEKIFQDNPMGQSDEQTPLVLVVS
ncbi:MAG: asparagine synthase (glutamine-hydrolyzing) [Patescibacteria group bacterium]|nr:asparagine synthase (glutamine-hydrolyzing) [Patescibacteria group bacterium]